MLKGCFLEKCARYISNISAEYMLGNETTALSSDEDMRDLFYGRVLPFLENTFYLHAWQVTKKYFSLTG